MYKAYAQYCTSIYNSSSVSRSQILGFVHWFFFHLLAQSCSLTAHAEQWPLAKWGKAYAIYYPQQIHTRNAFLCSGEGQWKLENPKRELRPPVMEWDERKTKEHNAIALRRRYPCGSVGVINLQEMILLRATCMMFRKYNYQWIWRMINLLACYVCHTLTRSPWSEVRRYLCSLVLEN